MSHIHHYMYSDDYAGKDDCTYMYIHFLHGLFDQVIMVIILKMSLINCLILKIMALAVNTIMTITE